MFELPLGAELVKHYPYRKAQLKKCYSLKINCITSPHNGEFSRAYTALHVDCANRAGVLPDNHEVYVFKTLDGDTVALWFSDWQVFIGNEAIERPF